MYAIGGPERLLSGKTTQGYILDINNGELLSTFNGDASGFRRPHDVAVSPDGTEVYVVELDRDDSGMYTLWKLSYGEDNTKVGTEPTTSMPQYLLNKLLAVLG